MTQPTSFPSLDHECFVITPIGADGSDDRKRSDNILNHIITPAAQELGLQPIRADQIATPGSITLQVIEHILGARAVIADITGRNPNVFYELGIRHAIRLPTVLIAQVGELLPFDVGHERTIFFDHRDLSSAASCRQQIVTQLHQAFSGSVESPVSTAVDIQRLRAGSPLEQHVAGLVTRYDELLSIQRHMLEALKAWSRSPYTSYSLARYSYSVELPKYLAAIDSNLRRLKHELIGAVGIRNDLVDAIIQDTFTALHGLAEGIQEDQHQATLLETVEESLDQAHNTEQAP